MSAEGNKAIARGYIEQVWNNGRLDLFEEFIADDIASHGSPGVTDAESMKATIARFRNAFPDVQLTLDDELAVEDKVVQRWTFSGTHQGDLPGMPASGKKATYTGITIFRLAGARIVEYWVQGDNLGMMQQLGFVPAPGA